MPDLAHRAARGEWNDYFGKHATPQRHLMDTLKARMGRAEKDGDLTKANAITKIALSIIKGKYDGTQEEAEEWARAEGIDIDSPEYKQALQDFVQTVESPQFKDKLAEIERNEVKGILS